jgi:hypothetical protein
MDGGEALKGLCCGFLDFFQITGGGQRRDIFVNTKTHAGILPESNFKKMGRRAKSSFAIRKAALFPPKSFRLNTPRILPNRRFISVTPITKSPSKYGTNSNT